MNMQQSKNRREATAALAARMVENAALLNEISARVQVLQQGTWTPQTAATMLALKREFAQVKAVLDADCAAGNRIPGAVEAVQSRIQEDRIRHLVSLAPLGRLAPGGR